MNYGGGGSTHCSGPQTTTILRLLLFRPSPIQFFKDFTCSLPTDAAWADDFCMPASSVSTR